MIAENRLTQIHGRGTFVVSAQQVESALNEQLIAFSEDLMLQHIPFETEVLQQRVVGHEGAGLAGSETKRSGVHS